MPSRLPTIGPHGELHDRRYNKVLQRAFPDCRMRWSERKEQWLLERKAAYKRLNVDPNKYPADAIDTFIQHRDGYYTAGVYEPTRLPHVERLVAYLRADVALMEKMATAADPVERAAQLAYAFESRDAERQRKVRKEQSFEHTGAGGELYDRLAWEEGRRAAVPRGLNFGSNPSGVRL